MAKKSGTNGGSRLKGVSAQRYGSRRLFDDVLALAGAFGRGRLHSGAGIPLSLASATRGFTAALTDIPNLRAQAAAAGDHVDALAEYAMHTDIEQLVKDAGTFTRRHPVAALAIVAATALVASRFMRRTTSKTARSRPGRRKPAAVIARKPASRKRKGTNGRVHASA